MNDNTVVIIDSELNLVYVSCKDMVVTVNKNGVITIDIDDPA